MSSWIFVITEDRDELKKRFKEKSWPIYEKTRYRKELSEGDKVVVYHGGRFGGKKLVASFTVNSVLAKAAGFLRYSLGLSDLERWKKPIKVKEILGDLEFIRKKDNWGMYFQGGVIRLPSKSYKIIMEKVGL